MSAKVPSLKYTASSVLQNGVTLDVVTTKKVPANAETGQAGTSRAYLAPGVHACPSICIPIRYSGRGGSRLWGGRYSRVQLERYPPDSESSSQELGGETNGFLPGVSWSGRDHPPAGSEDGRAHDKYQEKNGSTQPGSTSH